MLVGVAVVGRGWLLLDSLGCKTAAKELPMAEKSTATETYDDGILWEIHAELKELNILVSEQNERSKDILETVKAQTRWISEIDFKLDGNISRSLEAQQDQLRDAVEILQSIDMSARADHLRGVQSRLDLIVSLCSRLLWFVIILLSLLLWRVW